MNTIELELLLNQALVSKSKARYDVLKGLMNENYHEVQDGIENWIRVDTFVTGIHKFVKEEQAIENKKNNKLVSNEHVESTNSQEKTTGE